MYFTLYCTHTCTYYMAVNCFLDGSAEFLELFFLMFCSCSYRICTRKLVSFAHAWLITGDIKLCGHALEHFFHSRVTISFPFLASNLPTPSPLPTRSNLTHIGFRVLFTHEFTLYFRRRHNKTCLYTHAHICNVYIIYIKPQ